KLLTNYKLPEFLEISIKLAPCYISELKTINKIEAKAKIVSCRAIPKADRYYHSIIFIDMEPEEELSLKKIVDFEIKKNKQIKRVLHNNKLDYNEDFIEKRRQWLSEISDTSFSHISSYSINTEDIRGNVENFIGVSQVPTGLVGPIVVNGDHANGVFYVPFATTEGALVETYQRGAIAVAKSGGARVFINNDENHLDPVFLFRSIGEARCFVSWIKTNLLKIKKEAESTTKFGKLNKIVPYLMGRRVILDIAFYTEDAMGANMINIATEKVCKYISKEFGVERYLLRSNFASEKKASAANLLIGYGKEVNVEALVPARIIEKFLFSTSANIHKAWHSWAVSSFSSGMLGINAHYANGIAAIFIACGQDVAHVSNASVGITSYEITEAGDLYVSIKLPNIIIGTIGGGTALGTQKECLEILGCYGEGKAKKFAEIIGVTLLAGELGICAGITSEHFLDPHKRARTYTRKRAYQKEE
ncbi:MAG: hydroxymethylglutaryl-CoA reductase, partial [Elusimicrobiota bacterium]